MSVISVCRVPSVFWDIIDEDGDEIQLKEVTV